MPQIRIRKKYASLVGAWSPFDDLEVPGNATREEIRGAFLRLSKLYHPDRYFGTGEDLRLALEAIFERVTWARNSLTSER